MSIFSELKRRNVFRVAIAYLALAWLLTEVAGTLFPAFGIPDWAFRFVVIILVLGFVPTLVFSWAYEITPEGLKRESEVTRAESITHLTARRLDGITIGLIVLALAFVAVDRLWMGPRQAVQPALPAATTAQPAAGDAQAPAPGDRQLSIAVLPFVNMSADPANEYFSDGISEEILNLLARIPDLRVISRSSAFSLRNSELKIGEIARELDVSHVLEGSVRKSGNEVRITAQLIEAVPDQHLWSDTWDRTLDDVFTIQDEIASAVVAELKLRLLGEEPVSRKVDPEVYDRFLQARFFINQGSDEGYRKALETLNLALQIDPSFAPAWSELHRAYVNQFTGRRLTREEAVPPARDAINRAIELDPEDAVSLSRLGWFKMRIDDDLPGAAQHLGRALELEPGNDIVLSNAGALLATLGRIEEATTLQEWAMQRDPLNPTSGLNLAEVYFIGGRMGDAEAVLRKTLQLSPDYLTAAGLMARVLYNQGELEAAQQYLDRIPPSPLRQIGQALLYFESGDTDRFDATLETFKSSHRPATFPGIAFLLAVRGDFDEALDWLGRAADSQGRRVLINARNAPELKALRGDPRFAELLEKHGLAGHQLADIHFQVGLPD